MLKEKLSLLLKTEEGNSKKKIENLVYLLVILIITIIAINYIWNDKDKSKKVLSNSDKQVETNFKNTENSNEESLEKKLENILSKINGVGKADVMITYSESTQVIPVYNKKQKTIKCRGCAEKDIIKGMKMHNGIYCKIMDWDEDKIIKFIDCMKDNNE